MTSDFSLLLRGFQRRSGRSQRMVALTAQLDPARYSRLLSGERAPASREQVIALALALRLSQTETDRLAAAAGYLPPGLGAPAYDDPAVVALVDALNDSSLDDSARETLRRVVIDLAAHWHTRRVVPATTVSSATAEAPASAASADSRREEQTQTTALASVRPTDIRQSVPAPVKKNGGRRIVLANNH